ncbi:DUF5317 domain-containing protein [Micromonospora yasonensis]|uniref:DUF5317 domain-containing protein n=1 Tax=Micromonospora yasonensis TaxID=1128667 RepID=UPI002231CA7D|nr:DUF5317 domain-containing protein [Micromonospora yasonensis]MCW3839001.1 DUF5317 domain-containing protein [Micromonospora yasonensis]
MPVAAAALRDIGAAPTSTTLDPHHSVGTATTRLAILGDILPVPWLNVVISVGDIVLMSGIALLVAALMHRAIPDHPQLTAAERDGLCNRNAAVRCVRR